MKAIKRLTCLILSAISLLLFTACSSDGGDTVVATVNGEKVYKWQVINVYNQNKDYYKSIAGVDLDQKENYSQKREYMKSLLDQVIDNTVAYVSAKENGYELTAEEKKAAVDDDYAAFVERNIKFYIENDFRSDPAADEKAKKKLAKSLKDGNLTEERIKLGLYRNAVSKKLTDTLTKDVKVEESELKALYEKRVAEQKDKYTKNPAEYAKDAVTPQTVVYYSPAGYIRAKHILIGMPTEIQSRIDKLSQQLKDTVLQQVGIAQQKGENDASAQDLVKKADELQADIETLQKQGYEQIKATADDVLSKVKSGADFDTLIDQYGTDPGMKEYPAKKYGYLINKDTNFVPQFMDAAFALQNVGDTSELVQSDYGYHIIKLVDKIQEGVMPYEKCEKLLHDVLSAPKIQEIISAYVEKEKEKMTIVRYDNKL